MAPKKPQRGRPSQGRSEYLEVRLTTEEKSRYEQAAATNGLSVSDWVRLSLTAMSAPTNTPLIPQQRF
jgi:uncharacterized protein (DUF1778 family)